MHSSLFHYTGSTKQEWGFSTSEPGGTSVRHLQSAGRGTIINSQQTSSCSLFEERTELCLLLCFPYDNDICSEIVHKAYWPLSIQLTLAHANTTCIPLSFRYKEDI
jgi:hypothetical protein